MESKPTKRCCSKTLLRLASRYAIAAGFLLIFFGLWNASHNDKAEKNATTVSRKHLKIEKTINGDLRNMFNRFRNGRPLSLLDNRQAALRLLAIQRSLERAFTKQRLPNLEDIISLRRLAIELYPPVNITSVLGKNTSIPGLNSNALVKDSTLGNPLVCPEKYDHARPDTKWYSTNCTTSTPLSKLVTVVINRCDFLEENFSGRVEKLLQDFNASYPGMQVIVVCSKKITKSTVEEKKDESHLVHAASSLSQTELPNESNEDSYWSAAFRLVKTPFVLVARSMHRFSKNVSPLDRMVRVLTETPGVAVVGGAVRNSSRHWKVGCFQSELSNYVLRYSKGYHNSHNECMFCDYVDGPFLSYASLLRNSEKIKSGSAVPAVAFQEFFLNLASMYLTMACPDVMFYADASMAGGAEVLEKDAWLPLAKKLELNRVLIEYELSHVLHRFTCADAGIDCTKTADGTYSYAMPVCCREEMAKTFKFWDDFCHEHQFDYLIQAGTLLSAVKMADISPWDFNGDLLYSDVNHTYFKVSASKFSASGIILNHFKDPVCCDVAVRDHFIVPAFKMWTPSLVINMDGFRDFDVDKCYKYEEDENMVTRVEVHGVWLNSPHNPGSCSRSRYGREVLKHSQHWQDLGMMSSVSKYEPGVFESCVDHSRHDCLDKFPADGSLAFLIPEW